MGSSSVSLRPLGRALRWLLPKRARAALCDKIASQVADRLRTGLKVELKNELRAELKPELRAELEVELEAKLRLELAAELEDVLQRELRKSVLSFARRRARFDVWAVDFEARIREELPEDPGERSVAQVDELCTALRCGVREAAGLDPSPDGSAREEDLAREIAYLCSHSARLASLFKLLAGNRTLFSGQAYYSAWYLSRALRERGWKADLLNWDANPSSQIYYHGEDFHVSDSDGRPIGHQMLELYVVGLYSYDLFHFSNAYGISFGTAVHAFFAEHFAPDGEIRLLRLLGKQVLYSNNACHDGVSQTSFSRWKPYNVCSICNWRTVPSVCSDERNLAWGRFRNSVADYQCTLGGNRIDYNEDPRVHEVPEFFCLDPQFWRPDLEIPEAYRLPEEPGVVRLFHSVGNLDERTDEEGVNIKTTHIWRPLMERLRIEGYRIDWLHYTDVPNRDLRFYQVQADVFLDMLTYGWFGATAREAMMLGKPVVCFIRREWLESVREEIPEYAAELPVVNATPETAYDVLKDLIDDPVRRAEIGQRSRTFALKWHSADRGAKRLTTIYQALLRGVPVPPR